MSNDQTKPKTTVKDYVGIGAIATVFVIAIGMTGHKSDATASTSTKDTTTQSLPPLTFQGVNDVTTITAKPKSSKITVPAQPKAPTIKKDGMYVRGVKMPADCHADQYPTLVAYVEQHKNIDDADIPGYVCGLDGRN
jgi:hypothetical protein